MHRADAYRLKTFLLVGENDLLGMGQWSLTYDAYLWANKLRSILVEYVGYVMTSPRNHGGNIFISKVWSFLFDNIINIINIIYISKDSLAPSLRAENLGGGSYIVYISIVHKFWEN